MSPHYLKRSRLGKTIAERLSNLVAQLRSQAPLATTFPNGIPGALVEWADELAEVVCVMPRISEAVRVLIVAVENVEGDYTWQCVDRAQIDDAVKALELVFGRAHVVQG